MKKTEKQKRAEKLELFIKNNRLDFEGIGSDINSDYVIISGYALYIGVKTSSEIIKIIGDTLPSNNAHLRELSKVFTFARKNDYGDWWNYTEAESLYEFEPEA